MGAEGRAFSTSAYVIPVIRREDYAAFARDLNLDSEQTFDDWSQLWASELAEARRQGKAVVEVEIRYDEFARYCVERSRKPDAVLLHEFVTRPKPLSEA